MTDGAGEWVRCVSVAVQETAGFGDRLDHFGGREHGSHRRIAGGDALGQGHQIGPTIRPMLGGEKGAGAARAAHDLVIDQQYAMAVTDLANGTIVMVGSDEGTGGETTNRLHDEGQNRLRA